MLSTAKLNKSDQPTTLMIFILAMVQEMAQTWIGGIGMFEMLLGLIAEMRNVQ
jgi:hypothetical protein